MAKYRVCKPIEWSPQRNADTVMYFPAGHFGIDKLTKKLLPPPFSFVPSACHGGDIPIDASGVIELPDDEAAKLNLSQIAPLDADAPPDSAGYKLLGEALQAEHRRRGTEDRVGEPGAPGEWVSGAPREVTPVSVEGTMKVGGE